MKLITGAAAGTKLLNEIIEDSAPKYRPIFLETSTLPSHLDKILKQVQSLRSNAEGVFYP